MEKNVEYELAMLKSKKKKIISMAIIVVVILVVILAMFIKGYTSATKKYEDVIKELEAEVDMLADPIVQHEVATKEVSIDLMRAEIKDIGELATIEYLYTDAGKFEDQKQLFGKNISFTTKSFIAKWDGIIKAGIEVEDIEIEINDVNKEIIIYLPKAKILSHEIDSDSIETLDQKDGLFNPVKVEDVRKFDAISKETMEQRAIENGILDKAFENAKVILEKIVNNDTVQELEYIILFEEME